MKKEFIKINLRPRYIPNKYITYIVNTIGLSVFILFTLFYLVYLPYKDVNTNLAKAKFDNQVVNNETIYLSSLTKIEVNNPIDAIYFDTIKYIESTEIPLRFRINQLYSTTPNGTKLESIYFSLNKEIFRLNVTVDSDEALLVYIETLGNMDWIENVEFTEAGPGSIQLTISFEVGDFIE